MSTTVAGQISALNPKEWHYLVTHPHHAYAIAQALKKSVEETERLFSVNGHNDQSDAFRHCFWSAILARDIGFFSALSVTASHESSADNPAMERKIDLHNNLVGLMIGKSGGSDNELARSCMAALVGGRLKVLAQEAVI